MCGRYTLTSQKGLAEELQLAISEPAVASEWWRPRFNIAPTQPAPVLPNREGRRQLELMRWGLLPPWSKTLAEGAKRINARVETAATNRAFRDALRHRRCLVLADGFFEWRTDDRGASQQRLPFYFHPVPHRFVTFAGLWERWKHPDGTWLLSFTILTGSPNALVAPYHDRMPLVIAAADRERWLTPNDVALDDIRDLLAPWSPGDWQATPVSQHVNRYQNDDPQCVEPL